MKTHKKKQDASTPSERRAAHRTHALRVENLVGYNLRRAYGIQMQRFRSVFAPHSIRPVQLSILGLIYENPRMKQSELGRALEIKRANIVTLLDQLERRHLIERRRASTDRRSLILQLTPAGKKLTAELLELHARLEENLAEHLGARERDQLLNLLKKFRGLQTSPHLDYDV
ncbi:MAG TPA: MarR family transcriptional regulator [Gammaproteobacteria bacterium]